MASDVITALAEALRAPRPRSVSEAARAFGPEREQNSAMADLMLPPRPVGGPELEAWRKRSRSTLRSLQRYRGQGAEKRRPDAAARARLSPVFDRAQDILQGRRYTHAKRAGLSMRIVGWIQVSRTRDHVTMPSNVSGRRRYVHIAPPQARQVVDLWTSGQDVRAGALLLGAFFTNYWEDPEAVAYLQSIDDVQVAVAGEEPDR